MCCYSAWLWHGERNAISNAIGYAEHRSRSHDAVIRGYNESGNVIETHEHKAISKSRERLSHETKSRPAVKRDG
jgi:hypothetical protein